MSSSVSASRCLYSANSAIDLAQCSPAAGRAWRRQSLAPKSRLADRAWLATDLAGVLLTQKLLDLEISARVAAVAAAKMLPTMKRLLGRGGGLQNEPLIALVRPARVGGRDGPVVQLVHAESIANGLEAAGGACVLVDLLTVAMDASTMLRGLQAPLRIVGRSAPDGGSQR